MSTVVCFLFVEFCFYVCKGLLGLTYLRLFTS